MVVIGDVGDIEGTLNLRKRSPAVALRKASSTSSSAQRALAARTLVSSNTGLPGAYKAPEPPAPTKTLNKRDPFARREPVAAPTPITSQQMPAAPAPSPAPAEVVAMPGGGGYGGASGGGGGGGGVFADAPADASMVDFTKASSASSLLTPTNIAIGVVGLIGLVIVAKKVL